ncbi:MAG TPA: hypothetical protein VJO34_01060 [Methylomirabilota bacterium]|nr:hypothetical protein [Methylomirabilota bacterium]
MGVSAAMRHVLARREFLSSAGRIGLGALGFMAIEVQGRAQAQPPAAPAEIHHIHGLAVDQRDPEILYIATHTGLVRVRQNGSVERVGTHHFDLMGFTAHPGETNLVYASGHPDVPSYQKFQAGNLGMLVSRDGGQTWQSVALKGQADFHALTYSPRNGGELYGWSVAEQMGLHRVSVSSWKSERLPARGLSNVWSLAAGPDGTGPLFAGTKAGLMTSQDWGVSWAPVPPIPNDAPVTAVSYHTRDARIVYAYVARSDRGLMRSRDGGGKWEPTGFVADPRAPVVALAVGPGEHVVIAATGSDVLRSRDGGKTWQWVLERGRLVTKPR